MNPENKKKKKFVFPPERRRAVCRTCHTVMDDMEASIAAGLFFHKDKFKDGKKNKCVNATKYFSMDDKEVMPFMRKSTRRVFKNGNKM